MQPPLKIMQICCKIASIVYGTANTIRGSKKKKKKKSCNHTFAIVVELLDHGF